MELNEAIKLIKKYIPRHTEVVLKTEQAERYYRKENDILKIEKEKIDKERNIRSADNRIPSNFHKLLVNQETAYAFTAPPLFDVGDDNQNKIILKALGDAYAKRCKSLCVNAQNGGLAWIHYWKDEKGEFKYAVISCKQIIPIWSSDLLEELYGVIRTYEELDEETGNNYIVYEVWTAEECCSFRRLIEDKIDSIQAYMQFTIYGCGTGAEDMTNIYVHKNGEVPFIPFFNNEEATNNLLDIKELIDSYDKVLSGFVNDLEDIQQIIMVLTNYSGEADRIGELWEEIKQKKIIMLESEGGDDKSGVSTLGIEIPVEARKELLSLLRKAIFEQGQGIDPDPQNFGNSSGVALGYLYSLLELKTGMMETEFRIGFARLVRAICRHYGFGAEFIVQTWTRTSVSNDAELADIATKSKNIISDETILKNHPWVEDPTSEMERLKRQREENGPNWDNIPIKDGDEGGEE